MYRSDWRKEAGDALDEPLPAEACLERCEPEPLHLVEEPPQARVVARDCEVVQMRFQHLFHPSTGFRDGVVHYPAQLDLDRQYLARIRFLIVSRPMTNEPYAFGT